MVDGVAENQTAAMLTPYRDAHGHDTDNSGLSFVDPALLREIVTALDAAGIPGALPRARRSRRARGARRDRGRPRRPTARPTAATTSPTCRSSPRPRPPRFAELDAVANIQALWATHEAQIDELTLPFLQDGRRGAPVPVRRPRARTARSSRPAATGRSRAPTRWTRSTSPSTGSRPEIDAEPLGGAHQRLDLATAMAAYTSGTAYVNHRDHDTGSHPRGLPREPRRARPRPLRPPAGRDPPLDGGLDLDRGRTRLLPHRLTPEECIMPNPHTRPARRRSTRLTAIVAGGLGARSPWPACTASEPDDDAAVDWELTRPTTGAPSGDIDSFTWASYAEPYSLDYAYAFDYADNQVLANVCESLLRLNPDYTLTPGLAESFEHPTPTTWVYTIRDGVTFHDGTPLTAADVVASMSRHLDPAVGSSWYSVYQNVVSIEQTGDREVTVTEASAGLAVQPRDGRLGRRHRVGGHARGGGRRLRQLHRRRELHRPVQPRRVEVGRVASRSSATTTTGTTSLKAKSGEVEFVFMTDANARVNALTSGEVDGGWMVPLEADRRSCSDSSAGDMLLRPEHGGRRASSCQQPRGPARRRARAQGAADGARPRGHRRGRGEGHRRGHGRAHHRVGVGRRRADGGLADARSTTLDGVPVRPRGGEAARRGGRRRRRGDRDRRPPRSAATSR